MGISLGVQVALVQSVSDHPSSEKLYICKVEVGSGTVKQVRHSFFCSGYLSLYDDGRSFATWCMYKQETLVTCIRS